MRVLLLELNEINWHLLDPLIAAGKLPTFGYLKEHGAWGSPVSVDLPPYLDPWITWTTVYTGKPQTEHGVLFLEQPPETIRAKRVWDLASEAGLCVGIYGSLNSWPPRPVNGFWVPGTFSQDPATYPDSLRPIQELNLKYTRGYNYGLSRLREGVLSQVCLGARLMALGLKPRTVLEVVTQLAREQLNTKAAWRRVSLQPIVNFDFFSRLYMEYRPDFATFHTNHVAHYQHLYWRAMDPKPFPQTPKPDEAKTYGGAIEYGYRVADRLLQRALRLLSPDTVLVVASSMGQQPYVNRELDKGKRLLRLRSFEAFMSFLGLDGQIRLAPTMADQFNIYTATDEARLLVRNILAGVYIDRTEQPMFWIQEVGNSLTVTIRQYNTTADHSDCHFAFNGTERKVRYGELVEMFDHVKSGYHHPAGMLIIYGPGVQRGRIAGEITNLDLAPTILTLLGVKVPDDLAGRVLPEVAGSSTRTHSTRQKRDESSVSRRPMAHWPPY